MNFLLFHFLLPLTSIQAEWILTTTGSPLYGFSGKFYFGHYGIIAEFNATPFFPSQPSDPPELPIVWVDRVTAPGKEQLLSSILGLGLKMLFLDLLMCL
jgi:hypothetical protein